MIQGEPTTLKVAVITLVGVAKCAAHDTNDATVGDHEPHCSGVVASNVEERTADARKNFMVGFITRGTHVVFDIAGKLLVDFSASEALPGADVDFA